MAGYLRMTSAEYPDDLLMAELIGELSLKSYGFVDLWNAQPLAAPGQRIVFNGAAPGSESAERLRLLDSLAS